MIRALARGAAQPLTSLGGLLVPALGLLIVSQLVPAVSAAEASPLLIDPLDPRAEGEGPGLVGSPLLAALAVVILGIVAALATALYVRLGRR